MLEEGQPPPPQTLQHGGSPPSPSASRAKHMSSGDRWGLGRGLEESHVQKREEGRNWLPQSPRDLPVVQHSAWSEVPEGQALAFQQGCAEAPLGAPLAVMLVAGAALVLASDDIPMGSVSWLELAMLWHEERRWLMAALKLLHSLLCCTQPASGM